MLCITVALRQQAGRQFLTRSERSLPKRFGKSPGTCRGCPGENRADYGLHIAPTGRPKRDTQLPDRADDRYLLDEVLLINWQRPKLLTGTIWPVHGYGVHLRV